METTELLPHLFRTEHSKIVSVLCRHFGLSQLEIAEDIAAETFLTAAEVWPMKGVPPNPQAWLYEVAKNKTKNYLRRTALFNEKIAVALKSEMPEMEMKEIDLSPQHISDSQLQMMFAICHPAIPAEAQIGLSLRILCGFGIDEIADAFLTNKETINKRLFRAKEKLREEKVRLEFPGNAEIDARLETVLTTIYLLFSEGYYSVSNNHTIRKELCFEAMRLCYLLLENERTSLPQVNALMALMCFHASRFDARIGENGELVLYDEQDISRWDWELISRGAYYLGCAGKGNTLSKYHLEAAIAYWHTQKTDSKEKWESILQLYNRLLQIHYSPVAALNRTYALSRANGKQEAIIEAEKLKLNDNQFYFTLLGELYSGIDNHKATQHFDKAIVLAKTSADKSLLQKKIDHLRNVK